MKVSVCITTFNEEKTINKLLVSLIKQTKKADEVVVVDSDSSDLTLQLIEGYRNKLRNLKIITKKCSRAEGRNIAVKNARNEVIAMTDAGCVLDRNWVKGITEPFKSKSVDIVAGFYQMKGNSPFQKAISCFLGVKSEDFNEDFLPSTRSIAFKRGSWKRVGGFDKNLNDTAEDTVFNFKAVKKNLKIVRVKNALVYWILPDNLLDTMKKFYSYAKGDAKSKIFWHPTKKFRSHNIKVLLVFLRYFIFALILLLGFSSPFLFLLLIILLFLYFLYSFYKVYKRFREIRVGVWGVVIQFFCDLSVMMGFLSGIIS
ncbi:MAG TPA: glycosyltransferase [Patescibacteria group bacterium]